MKKQLIYLSLLPFLMAACSQAEKEEITNGKRAVSFSSHIGSATRATEEGFETGDAISVYAFQEGYDFSSGNFYAMNTKYVYQNGFVAAATPIFYPEDGTPLSFYAVYPYNTLENGGVFQVKENQEEENNYTMSDLMTASTILTVEAKPTLSFRHALASVQVNITNEYDGFSISDVRLCNMVSEAEISWSENKFKALIGGTLKDITMKSISNNSFKAIFPPQTKDSDGDFIRITGTGTSGQTVLIGKLNKHVRYDSGVRHTYNLRITNSGKLTSESEVEEPNPDPIPDTGEHSINLNYKIDVEIAENPNNIQREDWNTGWFQYISFTKDHIYRVYADQSDIYSEWYSMGEDSIFCWPEYYYLDNPETVWKKVWYYYLDESLNGYWFYMEDDYDDLVDKADSIRIQKFFLGELEKITYKEYDNIFNGQGLIWSVTLTRMNQTGEEYYAGRIIKYDKSRIRNPYPGNPGTLPTRMVKKSEEGFFSMLRRKRINR